MAAHGPIGLVSRQAGLHTGLTYPLWPFGLLAVTEVLGSRHWPPAMKCPSRPALPPIQASAEALRGSDTFTSFPRRTPSASPFSCCFQLCRGVPSLSPGHTWDVIPAPVWRPLRPLADFYRTLALLSSHHPPDWHSPAFPGRTSPMSRCPGPGFSKPSGSGFTENRESSKSWRRCFHWVCRWDKWGYWSRDTGTARNQGIEEDKTFQILTTLSPILFMYFSSDFTLEEEI